MKQDKEKKKKKNRPVNYKGGYRGELIRILLSIGCISYKGLHLLSGSFEMYTRKLKHMREEGITSQARLGTRRAEKLSNYNNNKRKYLSSLPEIYEEYYENYGLQNGYDIGKWVSAKQIAERAYRESEIYMLMEGAGFNIFPEEKPTLSECEKIDVTQNAYYYTVAEIKKSTDFELRLSDNEKEREKEKKKEHAVVNTRAMGCVFGEDGAYMIYHSGNKVLKWNRSAEGQISMYSGKLTKHIYDNTEYIGAIKKSIIYATTDKVFVSVFQNDKRKLGLLNLNCGYEEIYGLPLNEIGREMTSFMTRKNWKEIMKREYLSDYDTNTGMGTIVCDGVKDENRILLYCIPNLTRLEKFIMASEWVGDNKQFIILCFDFQESFVKEMAADKVTIKTVSFIEFCRKYIWTGV